MIAAEKVCISLSEMLVSRACKDGMILIASLSANVGSPAAGDLHRPKSQL